MQPSTKQDREASVDAMSSLALLDTPKEPIFKLAITYIVM
jgi:hypothetical protein